jgi:type III secretory pathway component EscV
LRLGRDAVPSSAVFPISTPVEIRLPSSYRALLGSAELAAAMANLRRDLAAATGVRTPGVRIVSHADETVAASLVADLRRWRTGLPDGVVVTVDGHTPRSVVWRSCTRPHGW